ncbi:hypothetical protein Angca_000083, partial [Angiostrongylus cantonensis]
VDIGVQATTSIDGFTNDFKVDIYITEEWMTPALNFENLLPFKGNIIEINNILKRFTVQSCSCSARM